MLHAHTTKYVHDLARQNYLFYEISKRFGENLVDTRVVRVADFESHIQIWKFKMVDPIMAAKVCDKKAIWIKLGIWGII